jgi:site-specific recombinase XerD
MLNSELGFSIDDRGQLNIDLSAPPAWLAGLAIKLPCGQAIVHHFGQPPQPQPFPLQQHIAGFLKYLEINEDRKPHTLTGYRLRLGQFAAWLALHPDQNPTSPAAWLAYYANLKRRDLSPFTLKGHYHILTRFSRWLAEQNHLPEHPLADVRAPRLPAETRPKAITKEHINAMLAAASTPRERAILLFFRDTGCRAMEALSLTWGDLLLDKGEAYAMGKRDKGRVLFFKPLTRRALEQYRATLKNAGPNDPVWQHSQDGPLRYDGLYKIFKRLAEAAGLGAEIFNPHAWRHAFGRDMTIKGIPTAQLQDLMGHSRMEVTKIYARFDTAQLKEAHDRYSPVDDDLA